jgi:aspartate 1-decarboxylase
MAGIVPFEKVEVYNITNGERFSTYAIEGDPGTICINGAAAWKARKGHTVIIAAYGYYDPEREKLPKPRLVYVDFENRPKNTL